jgi:heme-degrading monooxygenase HmoA
MFMRFTTVTGEQSRVPAALDFIEERLRPQVEATAGNQGLSTFAASDYGVVIALSYWADVEAMLASEVPFEPLARQAATVARGTLSREQYEVAAGYRRSAPPPGAVVEVSRFEFEPGKAAELVELFRTDSLPCFAAAPGLCATQLLLDRETGQGLIGSIWHDERAARAFWIPAGQLRTRTAHRVAVTYTGSDFYQLRRCVWAVGEASVGADRQPAAAQLTR